MKQSYLVTVEIDDGSRVTRATSLRTEAENEHDARESVSDDLRREPGVVAFTVEGVRVPERDRPRPRRKPWKKFSPKVAARIRAFFDYCHREAESILDDVDPARSFPHDCDDETGVLAKVSHIMFQASNGQALPAMTKEASHG